MPIQYSFDGGSLSELIMELEKLFEKAEIRASCGKPCIHEMFHPETVRV